MRHKRIVNATILTIVSILIGSAVQVWADKPRSEFGLRVSATNFWNYGVPRMYQTGLISELPEGKHILLDWTQVVRHFSGPDAELNFTTPLSSTFTLTAAARYQYIAYDTREASSFTWWDRQKSLNAEIHCFSFGSRIRLTGIVGQPYAGAFMGYCLVSRWRMVEHVNVPRDNASDTIQYSFVLVDGHGGGLFLDLTAGGSISFMNNAALFAEAGMRFPINWSPISIDYQQGFATHGGDPAEELDRNFELEGWLIRLGLEIRLGS